MPDPTDPIIVIPPTEVATLRALLARSFDADATPDQRCDARLRVTGRLLHLLDGSDR
jgi:hypothetical protein